jgi:xylulokinase
MPPPPAALALGIDLGTSAIKVVVQDGQGRVWASGSAGFPTTSALPGQAEQEPAHWLAALGQAMEGLDSALRAQTPHWRSAVAGIGLAGQLPTLVCLGARGPVGPAITWKDSRADAWASTAISPAQRRELYERTGMPIDGRYLGPMLRYHRPGGCGDIQTVLSAKDYLCFALTGQRVTDPSTAAGFGAYDLASAAFAADLCALWQLPLHLLPAVQPSHTVAGTLHGVGAQLLGLPAGIPVTTGAADSVAGAYALAGLEEGVVCIAMGSSTIIMDAVRAARRDPGTRYLLTPHVEPGWWGREMDLLSSGTGHQWLSGLFGWTDGQLDAAAATSEPGARGLAFAPYLAGGEQGARWDPQLRGALAGLTLQHGAPDIARAFLEGICFEIRRCIDVLAETAPSRGIVITGGIVEHAASLQMLADILARPVRAVRAVSAAAQGAARGAHAALAAVAGGAGAAAAAPLPTASSAPTGPAAPSAQSAAPAPAVQPGADTARYRSLYDHYRAVHG